MQLEAAVKNIFVQLSGTLEQLSQQQYAHSCKNLLNHSVGQHVRHIIELFQCLESGYGSGTVNYEKRRRDRLIETDPALASRLMTSICSSLDKPDKPLILEAAYDENSDQPLLIDTNYYREVAYNLEHIIHHMALIRIGISEISHIEVPETFGLAPSTIKHKNQCAP